MLLLYDLISSACASAVTHPFTRARYLCQLGLSPLPSAADSTPFSFEEDDVLVRISKTAGGGLGRGLLVSVVDKIVSELIKHVSTYMFGPSHPYALPPRDSALRNLGAMSLAFMASIPSAVVNIAIATDTGAVAKYGDEGKTITGCFVGMANCWRFISTKDRRQVIWSCAVLAVAQMTIETAIYTFNPLRSGVEQVMREILGIPRPPRFYGRGAYQKQKSDEEKEMLSGVRGNFVGAIGNCYGKLFSAPILLAAVRVIHDAVHKPDVPVLGPLEALKVLRAERGLMGLWRGVGIAMVIFVAARCARAAVNNVLKMMFKPRAKIKTKQD